MLTTWPPGCFVHCSDMLPQNFLTFEQVAQFDLSLNNTQHFLACLYKSTGRAIVVTMVLVSASVKVFD